MDIWIVGDSGLYVLNHFFLRDLDNAVIRIDDTRADSHWRSTGELLSFKNITIVNNSGDRGAMQTTDIIFFQTGHILFCIQPWS